MEKLIMILVVIACSMVTVSNYPEVGSSDSAEEGMI